MIISVVTPVRSLVSMVKNICSKSEDHCKEIEAKNAIKQNGEL